MTAPIITIFKNGDSFHSGKRLVLNRKEIRNFDAFLDRVTKDTRSQVAVRSIRTPSHGHRVNELDKLENGGIYVAVGPEKFKKLEYKELSSLPTNKPKPVEQIIKPVVHSRVIVSGRARKVAAAETTANKTIFVFRNGDDKHPSFKILLDKRILHTGMDTILQFITEKVRLRTGAVKSLYTLDGIEVLETSQIKSFEKYVAVGFGKKFLKMSYNENGVTSLTPRRGGPKIKSTSSEPPHRKKRPRPPVKAMSQGHVKSPPKNGKSSLDKEDSSSGAEHFDESNGETGKLNKNNESFERKLTQDMPESRASLKDEIEDANSNNKDASRKISTDEESSKKKSTAKDSVAAKQSASKENASTSSKKKDTKAKETKTAAEQKKGEMRTKLKEENKKKSLATKAESETEVIDGDDDKNDPTVFKATGGQGEKAGMVKDNEETNVEKPLDMLPAEEVEEELENNDDKLVNEDAANEDKDTREENVPSSQGAAAQEHENADRKNSIEGDN